MVMGVYTGCWEETFDNEKCNFPVVNVMEDSLKCELSNKVVYQGRIIGTKTTSPGVILDYITKWILSSGDDSSTTIPIEDDENIYVVEVDKSCPPYLASPSDSNCTPELSVSNTSDILPPLMAIIMMIMMMTVLIVAHFTNILRKHPSSFTFYQLAIL